MSPNNYIFTRTFVFALYCTHRVCVAQSNMKIYINFTGIVWLASPGAVALSVLQANVAFCKTYCMGIYRIYKKHKTHTEVEIIL